MLQALLRITAKPSAITKNYFLLKHLSNPRFVNCVNVNANAIKVQSLCKMASKVAFYSDQATKPTEKVVSLSTRQKLKQAVAQYGSTVITFHITISLMSLAACYTLISSGVDMSVLLEYTKYLGLSEGTINKQFATSTGTFAAAYLVHKVFAPVRLSITLAVTPFLVRYLRKMGWIKKAAPKGT